MTGYNIGHPWHYVLGGHIPTPKEILTCAFARGYRGYMESDIQAAAAKAEPARASALRMIRQEVTASLKADLALYRKYACDLRRFRLEYAGQEPACHEIHTSMSLKIAHLTNDFAHLAYLDSLPSQQLDLFDDAA